MPNTPAAVRQGVTVACAGAGVSVPQRTLCERLLQAIGVVTWADDEALLDPVTAVSGSGPAYVFLLAELLEQAAMEQGIPADMARLLARQTVAGSGALLAASPEDAAALRRAVTSPAGTTEAALKVLMAPDAWPAAHAAARSPRQRHGRANWRGSSNRQGKHLAFEIAVAAMRHRPRLALLPSPHCPER